MEFQILIMQQIFQIFSIPGRINKPFCFWYGSHEPHRKYEYGSGIKKGGKQLQDIKAVPGFWPDNPDSEE